MSHDSRVPSIGLSMSIDHEEVDVVPRTVVATPVDTSSVYQSALSSMVAEEEKARPPAPQPAWKPAEPERETNFKAWRQYRFSIDLLEIRDFRMQDSLIYLKYSYTPFGTSSYISTAMISISKSQKTAHLSHSFSAFEFIMSFDRLRTYLEGVPLVIEVWKKDMASGNDVCYGLASIDLSLVLQAQKNEAVSDFSDQGTDHAIRIQSSTVVALVAGTEEFSFAKIGDIRVSLAYVNSIFNLLQTRGFWTRRKRP
jgi:hypothetical protein